jgi:hypothetical protein
MRLASFCLFMIVAGSIGLVSHAIAGPTRVSPGGPGDTTEPVISSPGAPASSNFGAQTAPTNSASNSTSNSSSSAGNSGGSGSADENQNVAGYGADGLPILRAKPGREHEKVIQLKDGQKLPTSGVDPKFQGSLLNTSVDSIASIAPRKNKNAAAAKVELQLQTTNPKTVAKDGADPQKKSEPVYTRSSEKPSPTPTPSPTAKASSGRTP